MVLNLEARFRVRERTPMQAWPHLDGMGRDAGYALRSFARSPTFVASVVVSLAIGIGVVLLVFAVVRSWLLAPLPYELC